CSSAWWNPRARRPCWRHSVIGRRWAWPTPRAIGSGWIISGAPTRTMYVRLAALRPLLDAHLEVSAFEPEAGQMDGTLAHAVERIFLPCIGAAGFDSASVAALCGLPEADAPYPYARRS